MIANGVLHVIDNVLNPSSTSGAPVETLATQLPVFASASGVTNLPFTSAIPCSTDCPVTNVPASTGATGAKTTASASIKSSSSKAQAAIVARETGFAAGLMVAIGGAAMLI
jgi:hypothetical protein